MKTLRQLFSTSDVVQLVIRLGLLALLILWTLLIIRPFVPILTWSAVLAVAFYPVFSWLAKCLGGHPRTAAVLLTFTMLGIVIGPAAWLGLSAVEGVRELAGQLGSGDLALQARRRSGSGTGRWSGRSSTISGIRPTPTSARPCAKLRHI
ncbi:putative PurR-regulated permease PerM [Bradyrhizobium ottawaense]